MTKWVKHHIAIIIRSGFKKIQIGNPKGAILDEIQHCPDLFSYLQTLVDQHQKMSLFVLTGSQQFGLMAKMGQSLVGRVGCVQLLPFSLYELQQGHEIDLLVDEGGNLFPLEIKSGKTINADYFFGLNYWKKIE